MASPEPPAYRYLQPDAVVEALRQQARAAEERHFEMLIAASNLQQAPGEPDDAYERRRAATLEQLDALARHVERCHAAVDAAEQASGQAGDAVPFLVGKVAEIREQQNGKS